MRTLVTGGAGFIGSHVVDHLVSLKHDVFVLDDLSGGFEENVNPEAHFIRGSVTDEILVDSLFHTGRFDYVFHLAAYAAEGLSHFIRRFNYTNNLIGSVNLINNAVKHNVKCLVFTSSIAVYGSGQVPMHEDMTPRPEDPYGISKYAVEMDLEAARKMFGLNYIVFRPHNVYGERQNIGDPYRNVVGIFMNQLMQGKPCTIFGDGSQTRAFSYIQDVAPAIARSVLIASAYNKTFNIGAEVQYSVKNLALHVQNAMKRYTGVEHLPPRNEVQHAFSSHERFRSVFGTPNNTPLMAGLTRMAKWVEETGVKSGKPFDNIEIETNMPDSWRKMCLRSTSRQE